MQKQGISYPDLESGNEFWNRVRVPGSCYKSLIVVVVVVIVVVAVVGAVAGVAVSTVMGN